MIAVIRTITFTFLLITLGFCFKSASRILELIPATSVVFTSALLLELLFQSLQIPVPGPEK